ncbi:MAG: hypothetical protein OEX07_00265 [Gammaproteobacteria bacterium]|nr:hypothetical protein [Gammaproteobacteria bacterium]
MSNLLQARSLIKELRVFFTFSVFLILISCGGGGGGANDSNEPIVLPTLKGLLSENLTINYDQLSQQIHVSINSDTANLTQLSADPTVTFNNLQYKLNLVAAGEIFYESALITVNGPEDFPIIWDVSPPLVDDVNLSIDVMADYKDTEDGAVSTHSTSYSTVVSVVRPIDITEFSAEHFNQSGVRGIRLKAVYSGNKVTANTVIGTCPYRYSRYSDLTNEPLDYVGTVTVKDAVTVNGVSTQEYEFVPTQAYYLDGNHDCDLAVSITNETGTAVSATLTRQIGHPSLKLSATRNRHDGVELSWSGLYGYEGPYYIWRMPDYVFNAYGNIDLGITGALKYELLTPDGVYGNQFFDTLPPGVTRAAYFISDPTPFGTNEIPMYVKQTDISTFQYWLLESKPEHLRQVARGRLGLGAENLVYPLDYTIATDGTITINNLLSWATTEIAYVGSQKADQFDINALNPLNEIRRSYSASVTAGLIDGSVTVNSLFDSCPPDNSCDVYVYQRDPGSVSGFSQLTNSQPGISGAVKSSIVGAAKVHTSPVIHNAPFYDYYTHSSDGLRLQLNGDGVDLLQPVNFDENDAALIGIRLINTITNEVYLYKTPISFISYDGSCYGCIYPPIRASDVFVVAPEDGFYSYQWGFLYPEFDYFVASNHVPEAVTLTAGTYGEGDPADFSSIVASQATSASYVEIKPVGSRGNGNLVNRIYRSENSGPYQLIDTVNGPLGSYQDTTVTALNLYTYYVETDAENPVTGVVQSSVSPVSNSGFLLYDVLDLSYGGDISVTFDQYKTDALAFSWTASSGASFYNVDIYQNGVLATSHTVQSTDPHYIEHKEGVLASASYEVEITPYGSYGRGVSSGLLAASINTDFSLSANRNNSWRVNLYWNPVAGAASYDYYLRVMPYGASAYGAYALAGSTAYEQAGFNADVNSSYEIYVVANFTDGSSLTSPSRTYLHDVGVELSASAGYDDWFGEPEVVLDWSYMLNMEKVEIYRNNGVYPIATLNAPSYSTYTDGTVAETTSYSYYVKVYLTDGQVFTSASDSVISGSAICGTDCSSTLPPPDPLDPGAATPVGDFSNYPTATAGNWPEDTVSVTNITVGSCVIDKLELHYKFGTFFGEPTRSGIIAWENAAGTATNCLSNAAIVLVIKTTDNRIAYIDSSVGTIPEAGAGFGWDVTGSPSWSNLIRLTPGGAPVSVEEAKAIFSNVESVAIYSVN